MVYGHGIPDWRIYILRKKSSIDRDISDVYHNKSRERFATPNLILLVQTVICLISRTYATVPSLDHCTKQST